MALIDDLKNFCLTHTFEPTYWIAYSGGKDSHVLLHSFYVLRKEYPLKLAAIHINHGLSSNADDWQQHCAAVCDDLSIPFFFEKINCDLQVGESLEAHARQKRYHLFSSRLAQNDLLLTAHHADDQAETVLLQMLRGAGIKGLAAMPSIRRLGAGKHARPLLATNRKIIDAYAEKNNLRWIEDESNQNLQLHRNFIRHEILTKLQEKWPGAAQTLSRVAEHCAAAQEFLTSITAADIAAIAGSVPGTLSVKKILLLEKKRQLHVLRHWIAEKNFPLPNTLKLQSIQNNLLSAKVDKSPCVQWQHCEVRRYRDDMYLMQSKTKISHEAYSWDFKNSLEIKNFGVLRAEQVVGRGLRCDLTNISVRFRQGGETVKLEKRNCTHDLKKLFQSWKIPPWERDRIPLIFVGETLVAAVGFFIAEGFATNEDEMGFEIMQSVCY